MRLEEVLAHVSYQKIKGDMETEITALVYDSRKIQEGCLFICIEGANADGHQFVQEAVRKKAAALLISKPVEVEGNITVIQVENTRYAMAFAAAA